MIQWYKQSWYSASISEKLEKRIHRIADCDAVKRDLISYQLVFSWFQVVDVNHHFPLRLASFISFDSLHSSNAIVCSIFLSVHISDEHCADGLVFQVFAVRLKPVLQLLGIIEMDEECRLPYLSNVLADLNSLSLFTIHPQYE
jgi:hypothetical protein